jgi:hypothetical protein
VACPPVGAVRFGRGLAQAPAVADYRALAAHGDFGVRDFVLHTGERLPELRQHYVTWGTPKRAAGGAVTNAILLLHGTLGAGVDWGDPREGHAFHPLLGPGAVIRKSARACIGARHAASRARRYSWWSRPKIGVATTRRCSGRRRRSTRAR